MTTLFLGSYGFGNLGDELCLIEALQHFPTADAVAFSHDPETTARLTPVRRFISRREEIQRLKPKRVVLGGGGLGYWPSLRDSLHWMADARALGAELHIHNIGINPINHPEWLGDPVVRQTLGALASFSVRDHASRGIFAEWQLGPLPTISLYPEVDIAPEPFDLPLPAGQLVGFSFTSRPATRVALARNRDRIRRALDALGDFTAVPVIATHHAVASTEDDIAGFRYFAEELLGGRPIAFEPTLDPAWWRANMTPQRLKYLISRLDLLVSERKHNVIHAIGAGTRFLGVTPVDSDSIVRIVYSLRHRLPDGSSVMALA